MAPTLRSFGVPFSGSRCTRVYNKLPQHIVDSESCNESQHPFTVCAKDRRRAGAFERRMIYSPGRELYGHLYASPVWCVPMVMRGRTPLMSSFALLARGSKQN